MAKAPLTRVGQHEDLDIVWHPFELRPEPAPLLDPNSDYIRTSWEQSVLPLSKQLEIEMKRPTVIPRTRLAHEAAAYADTQGKANEMVDALYAAYQQQGRDIGRIDVLTDVGESIGLDVEALRDALQNRTMKHQVDARLALAKQMNVTAVPYFVIAGRYALRGLVSADQLQSVIEQAGNK